MFIVAKSFTNKRGEMFLKIFPNQYRFCIERAQSSLGKPAIREIIEIPLRAYANGVE